MLPLTSKPDSDDNHWKHLYSLRHKEWHSLDGEAMAAGDLRASSPRAKIPSPLKHLLPCGFADFVWELWQRPDWTGTDFNFILCRVAKHLDETPCREHSFSSFPLDKLFIFFSKSAQTSQLSQWCLLSPSEKWTFPFLQKLALGTSLCICLFLCRLPLLDH